LSAGVCPRYSSTKKYRHTTFTRYQVPRSTVDSASYPQWDEQMTSSLPSVSYGVKAGMAHSVYAWTRGVQVKLWDPLITRVIPERLRGVYD